MAIVVRFLNRLLVWSASFYSESIAFSVTSLDRVPKQMTNNWLFLVIQKNYNAPNVFWILNEQIFWILVNQKHTVTSVVQFAS